MNGIFELVKVLSLISDVELTRVSGFIQKL